MRRIRTVLFTLFIMALILRPLFLTQMRSAESLGNSRTTVTKFDKSPSLRFTTPKTPVPVVLDTEVHEEDGPSTKKAAKDSISLSVDAYDKVRRKLQGEAFHTTDDILSELRSRAMSTRIAAGGNNTRWQPGVTPGPNTAPLRACFVTLVRHAKGDVERLYRLLLNVREMAPLMASRYPMVVFHESAVSDEFMMRLLLEVADDHLSNKRHYKGTEDDSIPMGIGVDIRQQQNARDAANAMLNMTGKDYRNSMRNLKKLSRGQLSAALRRYVFPAGVEMETLSEEDFGTIPRWVKSESVKRWPYPSKSYWGVSYRHMCRFYGSRIFYTKAMQTRDFDYYLRLDVDSFILAPLTTAHVVPDASEPDEPATKEVELDLFEEFYRRRYIQRATLSAQQSEAVFKMFKRLPLEGLQKATNDDGAEAGPDDTNTPLLQSTLPASPKYGFVMLHPQTMPVFLEGIWDAFDNFVQDENKHRWEHSGHKFGSGSTTTEPLREGKSLFSTPRSVSLHYWDNFEIVDINMFRERELPSDALDSELTGRVSAEAAVANGEKKKIPKPQKKYLVGGPATAAELDHLPLTSDLIKTIKAQLTTKLHAARGQEPAHYDDVSAEQRIHVEEHLIHSSDFWRDFAAAYTRRTELAIEAHNSRYRSLLRMTDAFDKAGGYYYHRWGDAEIRTLTMAYHVPPEEILYMNSLPYQHYHNYHCPNIHPKVSNLVMATGWEVAHNSKKALEAVMEAKKQALTAVRKTCLANSKRDFGHGSKGRGTASMDPAEHPVNNQAFHQGAASGNGWSPV